MEIRPEPRRLNKCFSVMNQLSLTKIIFGLILLGFSIASLGGCAYVNVSLKDERKPLREQTISGRGPYKILVTDVSGFISSSERQDSLLSNTMLPSLVSRVKEEIEKAEKDKKVRAVVLRINSPGGTVTASDMIYHEISAFRTRTGRPVIASIMDLGTSGAYYIAQAADRVISHPTTVTGSIGVFMVRPDIEGLLSKLGIRTTEIKSGELKAMGSPFKPLSPEEQKVFQSVIDEMYDRFLKVVMDGRKGLSQEKVRTLADGRIYTAQQALEAGLIDGIGYLSDAVELAKELAGLDQARVVMYQRPGDFKGSFYAGPPLLDPTILASALDGLTTPQFLYLWMP
jgi:protease-4